MQYVSKYFGSFERINWINQTDYSPTLGRHTSPALVNYSNYGPSNLQCQFQDHVTYNTVTLTVT